MDCCKDGSSACDMVFAKESELVEKLRKAKYQSVSKTIEVDVSKKSNISDPSIVKTKGSGRGGRSKAYEQNILLKEF